MSYKEVPPQSGIYSYYEYGMDNYILHHKGFEWIKVGNYYLVYKTEKEKLKLFKRAKLKSFWENLLDWLVFAIKVLGVVILILGGIVLLIYLLLYLPELKSCEKTGLIMELPHKFDIWAGCFIKYKGMWFPEDQIIRAITGK